jgi:signal transduction histidine kinase
MADAKSVLSPRPPALGVSEWLRATFRRRRVHDARISGPTIRVALVIGFGCTFGIWLFAGYHFMSRIDEVQRQSNAINSRYLQAQELLSTVRAQIFLSSIYVRDAVLDPDRSSPAIYRRRLEDTHAAVNRTLDMYVPISNSADEQARAARLRQQIGAFQEALLSVLDADPVRSPNAARLLLRDQVAPRREEAIRVSEEIQALNRTTYLLQQSAADATYESTQHLAWASLGVALAANIGIGLLAMLYAGRLEDRLRTQQLKDEENARELQRLSAKLLSAQEEERRTIARELHDEIGQVLTAVKVELAVAQHAIDTDGERAHLLDSTRSIVDGALTAVRDLSHLLHPALLDDLGLPAAVEWYLRRFGQRHDIRVEIVQDRMDERLSPETEAAAFRIVQEALTNVAKHAHATICRVYLQRLPNTVLITIEDNGVGFDPSLPRVRTEPRGLGLIGIRERVTQLQGTLRVEAAPGRGTRLTVELPASWRTPSTDAGAADAIPA